MVPSAQRRTNPQQSGIEWVTLKGSISNGPAVNFFLVLNTLSLDGTKMPFSFKRFLISCAKEEYQIPNHEENKHNLYKVKKTTGKDS